MATPNPISKPTSPTSAPPISKQTHHIAGILVDIYGLDDLPAACTQITCIWLLNPRLQTKETMAPIAHDFITAYNKQRSPTSTKGIIAAAFDQRNHGTREVLPLANEAWRQGNTTHAQDMFGIYAGTAVDVGVLIDHLGSHVCHTRESPKIVQHFVFGISLGGHASWQCLFHESRISAGVVVIGCPDYARVMADRARLSKLDSFVRGGSAEFFGSKDFPERLVEACGRWDPKGMLFGSRGEIVRRPDEREQARLRPILNRTIRGKKVLVCSGADDKLVPYHASKEFMAFLGEATGKGGWYEDAGCYVEDVVYEGVGHAYSEGMARDCVRFFCNLMEGREPGSGSERGSL